MEKFIKLSLLDSDSKMVNYQDYLSKVYPNTKARIIAILSISIPLSARKIYHKIKYLGYGLI